MNELPFTAIIFGTDTGNTEDAAYRMSSVLESHGLTPEVININEVTADLLADYDLIIMGIPTWDFGGIQQDWEERDNEIAAFPVQGKTLALYGLGDQLGYGEFFLDAVGWLHERLATTGARFVGFWPTEGYTFEASRALTPDGKAFFGLALDEDIQPEQTDNRITRWLEQVLAEYHAAPSN
ncbi:flavodoxin long chain [Marinobacterium sp. MBR-111]|uniref:flavodoxin n=1 Tax=Marinobacterium sp. MBR-111 TaxID=3156463 RepID=UPI003398A98E